MSDAKSDGECKYDWIRGFEGTRLGCVVHRHHSGETTLVRDESTLFDMYRAGVLTGRALQDARLEVETRKRREPKSFEPGNTPREPSFEPQQQPIAVARAVTLLDPISDDDLPF